MPTQAEDSVSSGSLPPVNWEEAGKPPAPPTAAEMLDPKGHLLYQLAMARHLAFVGIAGPYQIGDWLCDVTLFPGLPVKVAAKLWSERRLRYQWVDMRSGETIDRPLTLTPEEEREQAAAQRARRAAEARADPDPRDGTETTEEERAARLKPGCDPMLF